VWLLRSARASLGSSRINFVPEKRYQLLAYLAYSQDWVSRERLAYLFWPDTETHKAQQNLRQLLKSVRSLPWLEGLETNKHKVCWPIETDVKRFRQAIEGSRLDEALALYEGPLFSGIERDEVGEFSHWLELERTHLHSLWRETLLKRVQTLQDTGNDSEAARLLTDLLSQDALDEEALIAYLQVTGRAGQGQQGLRAYREFKKKLQQELDLEPTSTTQRLAEALEKGDNKPFQPSQSILVQDKLVQVTLAQENLVQLNRATLSSLPIPTTSFVGRELELAELAHLFSKPECRLVTLVGPGGIGKTRLALRAAEELAERYEDGVYCTFLDALPNPDAIASSLAQSLGVTLEGADDPLTQVIRFIREKHLLLVLDNFEHLLGGVTLVSRLLQSCPKLELMVTSRERLNLAEEWLLPVAGLPYTDGQEALTSDAVTLFVERAQQVQPTFTLSAELPHVLEICHLLGGSPLAIELSAVWVRMMAVKDIAGELRENLDLLTSSLRNVPERQASIRATFEHSWKLLTPKEQEVLSRLSIFRGGFTREAASVVAGASVAVLAALVDKSLLRVTANGRYDFHPLLYQYIGEKLAERPEEQAQTRTRCGEYFYTFLARLEKNIFQTSALDAVGEEFENIRVALDWLVMVRPEDSARVFETLNSFLDERGRYEESIRLFAEVSAKLDETKPEHHSTLGNALVHQAWSCLRLGHYEDGRHLAERGLTLVSLPEAPIAVLVGYNTLAAIASTLGEFEEALKYRELGSSLIQTIKAKEYLPPHLADRALAANTGNTAIIEVALGRYPEAKRHREESLRVHQRLGNVSMYADGLTDLGKVLLLLGKPSEALPYLQEGLELAREVEIQDIILAAQAHLAAAHLELGDAERAFDLAREAGRGVEECEQLSVKLEVLLGLGEIASKLDDEAQSRRYSLQALKLAWMAQETPKVLAALVGLARLQLRKYEAEKAVPLLALASNHPKTEYQFRNEAQQLLRGLENQLSAKVMKKRLEQVKAMTLEEAVEVARGSV
jgi:predicted ATPase/DNA-binding SARP family transcriptional activator